MNKGAIPKELPGKRAYMGVKRDRAVEKVVRPFQAFADKASSGGILLIAACIVLHLLTKLGYASAPCCMRAAFGARNCQGYKEDREETHPSR